MAILPTRFNPKSDHNTRNKGRRRADSYFQAFTTGGTTSGATELTLFTVNIPTQPGPYILSSTVLVTVFQSVGTETFELRYRLDGAAFYRGFRLAHTSSVQHSESVSDSVTISNFAPRVFTVGIARIGGGGTMNIAGNDGRFGLCTVLIDPL